MAEDNKNHAAKEEMGELFVSIGATGLGSLLKGLSAASAGFIATKTAAEQIIKPIVNVGKSSVEIGKINSQLGGTYEQLQQIRAFFKQKGLNEGLIGDIAQIQQSYAEFFRGKGFPDNIAIALGEMHIDWTTYTDSLESVLSLIQNINEATAKMDKTTRQSYLNEIGLSDWAYAFDRGINFKSILTENLLLKNNDIQNTIEAAEAINQFNLQMTQLGQILASKVLPAVTPFVQKLNEVISNKNGEIDKAKEKTTKATIGVGKKISANPLVAVPLALGLGGAAIKHNFGKKNPSTEVLPPLPNVQPSQTIPSNNIKNQTLGNVTIVNEIDINSNESPSAIAEEIQSLNYDQLQRNQYELNNRPGR